MSGDSTRIALRAALLYAVSGALWIIVTDFLVLFGRVDNTQNIIQAEILKGIVFVIVTTGLLYLVLRAEFERRLRAEAQLQYQSNILQNVSDAVIAVDFDYRVQGWNGGAEAIYGWHADEVFGKPLQALVNPIYPGTTLEQIVSDFEQNHGWTGAVIHHRRDGKPLDIVASVTYLKDSYGKNLGMVSVNRNVTDQKRLESEVVEKEKLFVALENERKVQEIRTRFMRMVSHEFRTPLAVIATSYDMLTTYADRLDGEQRAKRLSNIAEQVTKMRDLLDEVSLLLNTDSTQPQYMPAALDFVTYCQTQIAEIRRTFGETHTIELIIHTQSAQVSIDGKLMQHVINNLVYNAIKYSPKGRTIRVGLESDAENVMLSVTDAGIGIPEADLPHIFEPFFRASNVENVQGSGLGLAIVKQIIDLHQGSIEVKSRVGEGTTFKIKLPLLTSVL